MAIWGVETGYYGRLVIQGRGPRLETYLCAIPHLITWLNMCKGHFLPLLVSLWRWRAPKYGHLGGENRAVMAGLLWGGLIHLKSVWCAISHPYT